MAPATRKTVRLPFTTSLGSASSPEVRTIGRAGATASCAGAATGKGGGVLAFAESEAAASPGSGEFAVEEATGVAGAGKTGVASLRGFSLNFEPGSADASAAAISAVGEEGVSAIGAGAEGVGLSTAGVGTGAGADVGTDSESLGLSRIMGAGAGVAATTGLADGGAGGSNAGGGTAVSAAAGAVSAVVVSLGFRRTFGVESADGVDDAALGVGSLAGAGVVDSGAGGGAGGADSGGAEEAGVARGFSRRTGVGFCSSLMRRAKEVWRPRYSKNRAVWRGARRGGTVRSPRKTFTRGRARGCSRSPTRIP